MNANLNALGLVPMWAGLALAAILFIVSIVGAWKFGGRS